jgi:hypothetical protein
MKIPEDAEVITTFAEYARVVETFFDGHLGLLVLVGRPGLSKSFEFERQIAARQANAYILRGMASPFKLYANLYENMDKFIILDDAEVVWGEKDGRVLLRALCEVKKPCQVSWEKASRWLEFHGYPNTFQTHSRVCLICNKFHFGKSEEFAAIADRGHLVFFDPSPAEVHRYAGTWFPVTPDSKKIYKYIGRLLDYMPDLSFRVYEKSLQNLKGGRDWQEILQNIYLAKNDMQLVIDLEKNRKLSGRERLQIFAKKAKCGSRGAYYKYRAMAMRHQPEGNEGNES